MELTGKKLEEILNTELVGRDVGYSHWNFTNALFKIIRILAKEAGLDENAFSSTVHGTQSAHLTYRGMIFGDASFQKQKGKYCRGGYEWSFKKIFVNFFSFISNIFIITNIINHIFFSHIIVDRINFDFIFF